MPELNLSNQKFFQKDFSGQDLRGVPMDHSEFICCDFRSANISENDCSHSAFNGSDLTNVSCNRTNFAHTTLACKFHPKDAYGITLTMECRTFRGMNISKLWWFAWIFFGTMMNPEKENQKDLRDIIIAGIGGDRYLKLKKMFEARQL